MNKDAGGATVADYMNSKMATLDRSDSVLAVARTMAKRSISSVAITDKNKRIMGILTERDVIKAIANGIPPDGITAGSLMSHPVISVKNDSSVKDAARVMAQKKLRHLLVSDSNNEVVGIITATDLVRYLRKNLTDEELIDSEVWEMFF